jgi:hypothetical protein
MFQFTLKFGFPLSQEFLPSLLGYLLTNSDLLVPLLFTILYLSSQFFGFFLNAKVVKEIVVILSATDVSP